MKRITNTMWNGSKINTISKYSIIIKKRNCWVTMINIVTHKKVKVMIIELINLKINLNMGTNQLD